MNPQDSIGHYRIVAKIGEGGMGAVYRATDTKLKRDVAIKVLPERLANDPEYLARFQREAQVLASLNHPNIAAIHGIEEKALVMEFVPGDTLEERIADGPIPLEDTLPIARQIADALEAAHEKGIVHRDLKPANIKVTPEGLVKVLDFGLAKTAESPSGESTANSPTLTMRATQPGLIMGTAAYMAPEQAKGKAVDRRADIWAFGVILWEMLTGRRMYAGDTVAEILAAVLKDSPDLGPLPPDTPAVIRELLRRCLEKDPRRRLRDTGEARIQIEDYIAHPDPAVAPELIVRQRPVWPFAAVSVLALLLAVAAVYWQGTRPAPERPATVFTIPPPAGTRYTNAALSPDGRRIAMVIQGKGPRQIWIRDMDSPQLRLLAGTNGASTIFWSPDSRSLGFIATPLIRRIDVASAQVQTIYESPSSVQGATWNANDVIVAALFNQSLVRLPASGGSPQPLLDDQPALKGLFHRYPRFLPDGRRFLFNAEGDPSREGIYLGSLDPKEPARRILRFASECLFAADENLQTGHILFRNDGALMAVRFDASSGKVMGEPFVIHDRAGPPGLRLPVTASVPANVIAWREVTVTAADLAQIYVLDRTGKRLSAVDVGATGAHPELSPDAGRLVSERQDPTSLVNNLWLFDLNRKVTSRLAFGTGAQGPAVWSPDGKSLIFVGTVDGVQGIFMAPADGSRPPQPFARGIFHHLHVTPDGKTVAAETGGGFSGHEIDVIPLQSGAAPTPLVKGTAIVGNPQISPDGHWFSYSSTESGHRQVYVESFPPGNGRWQVSSGLLAPGTSLGGGGNPSRWRKDGREIIYYDEASHDVWSVPVTPRGASLEFGTPVKLFEAQFLNGYFAITPDAQRFYANLPPETPREPSGEADPLTVVLNWRGQAKK